MNGLICALCECRGDLIVGRTGVLCKSCLGKAVVSILDARTSDNSMISASDRCLLCGEPCVRGGDYAAVRRPYSICAKCMKDGLDAAGARDEFLVASF